MDFRKNPKTKFKPVKRRKKRTPLNGKAFVFTGQLEHYTRTETEGIVERLGGRATSGVSGNTDYVVAGRNPGCKLDEAGSYDVKSINEQDFQEMLKK